jgi:hypothetical protein
VIETPAGFAVEMGLWRPIGNVQTGKTPNTCLADLSEEIFVMSSRTMRRSSSQMEHPSPSKPEPLHLGLLIISIPSGIAWRVRYSDRKYHLEASYQVDVCLEAMIGGIPL